MQLIISPTWPGAIEAGIDHWTSISCSLHLSVSWLNCNSMNYIFPSFQFSLHTDKIVTMNVHHWGSQNTAAYWCNLPPYVFYETIGNILWEAMFRDSRWWTFIVIILSVCKENWNGWEEIVSNIIESLGQPGSGQLVFRKIKKTSNIENK